MYSNSMPLSPCLFKMHCIVFTAMIFKSDKPFSIAQSCLSQSQKVKVTDRFSIVLSNHLICFVFLIALIILSNDPVL